jgi:hypothetical protein
MSPKIKHRIPFVFIFMPVFVYLYYAWYYSVSVFFADDFHLLEAVIWIQDAPNLGAKLKMLLQQHNEHRIVVPRLVTYLSYRLVGYINWPALILLGNLVWASVLWFFWKWFRANALSAWLFLPIPFIFLQPQYHDNVTWAISILQQSVIVFWFVLLSYLCAKRRFGWAMVVCVLATFTHGSGMFSFLVGIIFPIAARQWRMTAVWAATAILTAILYFHDFSTGQNADIARSFSHPLRLVGSFFAFFGSITRIYFMNPWVAVLAGVLLWTIAAFSLALIWLPKYGNKNTFAWYDKMLIGITLFLCLTGALVAVSRSWLGIESVLAPRYQQYSALMACVSYLLLVTVISKPYKMALGAVSLVLAALFNLFSYFEYTEEIIFKRNWLVADDTNWYCHQTFLNQAQSVNNNMRQMYITAVERGICKTRNRLGCIPPVPSVPALHARLRYSLNARAGQDASNVYQKTYLRIEEDTLRATDLFLCLSSDSGHPVYWLPTRKGRNSVGRFLATGSFYRPGFTVECLTENIPAGKYRVSLFGQGVFAETDLIIDLGP